MSVAGVGLGDWVDTGGGPNVSCLEEACTVSSNVSWDLTVNRQADMTENITFSQLRWRVVKTDIIKKCQTVKIKNTSFCKQI